ncbi:LLM class flavin-dependent oxidoreductase [Nocardia sp. alder85J]|uniref:LLM class flavin-dependent oxidoreductase n=1 Tax=Nocardia sp. alder85J TaxID=2862949 RepID=UPI001CD3AEB4|nr:LLM class flavin-dependent oxidoreductase [Nocardia sp. alder85J]MCX4093841.1 LLM class flavin-dependent oxidoreductase [Nocardia sp. alder85J]
MRVGAYLMPCHPPERPIAEGHRIDVDQLELLERAGCAEAWLGEHFTARWAPGPAPDLLIAQAFSRTSSIRLGPLGQLPCHHPIESAYRAAYLDHLGGGRYQFGVASGALPTDRQVFGVDRVPGLHRAMTFDALDTIVRLWTYGPEGRRGRFWAADVPDESLSPLGHFLMPMQRPHPPIALAAMRADSAHHRRAGAGGHLPVSLTVTPDNRYLARHFATVAAGAAEAGRVADRGDWRIVRDVYVADTDAEARHRARTGAMGRCWEQFLLPLYLRMGLAPLLGRLPNGRTVDPDRIDLDFVAERLWLTGSPDTVAEQLADLCRETGGFGTLLLNVHDFGDELPAWRHSVDLLTTEVLPRVHARESVGAR